VPAKKARAKSAAPKGAKSAAGQGD
jgi:hypothetical protein